MIAAEEIQQWMIDKLVEQSQVQPSDVDIDKRLAAYGIDSLQMVSLVGQMEAWLECHFTSNPLERYGSIRALSQFVADQLSQGNRELDPLKS